MMAKAKDGLANGVVKERTPTKGDPAATATDPLPAQGKKANAESTPNKAESSSTKQEAAINERQREGARRERETQADLEREHPDASVQREQLLRDASGKKVKDPLTETGRRVDHVVIKEREVARSVETTSPTADKAAQIAKEKRVREAGGNFVRDRRTGELVPVPEGVKTEVVRRR
jgi:hypothetical protein